MWTWNPSNVLGCVLTKETWIRVGFLSRNVYRGLDGEFWQVWVDNEPFCLLLHFLFVSLCHVFGKRRNDNRLHYRFLYTSYAPRLHSYLFGFRLPKFTTPSWTRLPLQNLRIMSGFSWMTSFPSAPHHIFEQSEKDTYNTYKAPPNNTLISRLKKIFF